jgi:hypothetical protein
MPCQRPALRWALLLLNQQIACALIAGKKTHSLDERRCFARLGIMSTCEVACDLDRARREVVVGRAVLEIEERENSRVLLLPMR